MYVARNCLRNVHCTHRIESSSNVRLDFRRHASGIRSPIQWLRDNLVTGTRPKPSTEEITAARQQQIVEGKESIFDAVAQNEVRTPKKKVYTEHKYSTANFKISPRKLNMLGRQIAGKPIDHAILQMMFSEKRASKRIKSMLALARDHAVNYKGLEKSRLVVAESWVSKGPNYLKRLEIRGRGRHGVRVHPDAKLSVVLKEGRTYNEQKEDFRKKQLKRIVSAGLVREDKPLRNPGQMWAW